MKDRTRLGVIASLFSDSKILRRSSLRLLRLFVASISFGLCLYHSYAWRGYLGEVAQARAAGGVPADGMQEIQLGLIHLSLSVLLFFITLTAVIAWRFAKHFAVLAGVGVSAVYIWWYSERYVFLKTVYELEPDSIGADSRLAEIGLFIGATQYDYIVFGITLIVILAILIWSLSRPSKNIA